MKKVYCLISLVVIVTISSILILTGCKKKQNVYLITNEAIKIARTYLNIENDRYVFNLTSQQAEKLSISPKDYRSFVDEVFKTNTQIAQTQQGKRINYSLSLPVVESIDEMILSQILLYKSGEEGELKGGESCVIMHHTNLAYGFPQGITT